MAISTTILRRIRLLSGIPDAVYGDAENEYLFTDEEIEDFFAEGFENVKCAAGLIKQAIGASEAFLLKQIKNYETTTNGAALMREWTSAGEKLYDAGLAEISDADGDIGIFEIAFPDFDARHPEGMSHGGYRMGGWL